MRASGIFKVVGFTPAPSAPDPTATAAQRPVGTATIKKLYEGAITGRSATSFIAALDQPGGFGPSVGACGGGGPYLAMESFEGALDGRDGAFDFVHAPTTPAASAGGMATRSRNFFRIMPASGTGRLAGIRGTGGMAIDADGTQRIWFDYELS